MDSPLNVIFMLLFDIFIFNILQNDIPPEVYKLKKLALKFDKLKFESVSGSNLWAQDISVISENKMIIVCYLPDHCKSLIFVF